MIKKIQNALIYNAEVKLKRKMQVKYQLLQTKCIF